MSSPASSTLSSFAARVQWAVRNRRVYTFPALEGVDIRVRRIDENDDDADVEHFQQSYERKFEEARKRLEEEKAREEASKQEEERKRLEKERRREEERKRCEEEAVKKMEALYEDFPNLRPPKAKPLARLTGEVLHLNQQAVAGSSKRTRISNENDDDDDEFSVPKKRSKTVELQGTPEGPQYPVPCDSCSNAGYECREQVPVKKICYRCASLRQKCSLKPGPKYGRGANRGKIVSRGAETEDESEEEVEYKSKDVPRRSLRGENDVTRDDIKALTESIRAMHKTFQISLNKIIQLLLLTEKWSDDQQESAIRNEIEKSVK